MGRSTRVITLEETAQVEAMAAYGHTQEEIAEFLGMSARSFGYKKKENKILHHFKVLSKQNTGGKTGNSFLKKIYL